jgi:hypothetical protein
MIAKFAVSAAIIAIGTGLANPQIAICPQAPEIRPAQMIYVGEDEPTKFDARRGDTVIVVMNSDGDHLARCNQIGGELIYNPFTLIFTCEDVDF